MIKVKKGQLYVLVALILGVIAYLVVSQTNIFIQEKEPVNDLQQVSTNFVSEGNRLLNTLQGAKPKDISYIMSQFSDTFVYSYARPTDPKFGLVYILHNKEQKVVVENYLGTVVMIDGKELQYSDVECILIEIDTGGKSISTETLTSRWCKQNLLPEDYRDLSRRLEQDRGYGLEYSTELNIQSVSHGDFLIIDIEGTSYFFTVGEEIELSAVTRRTEEGKIEIFQSQ